MVGLDGRYRLVLCIFSDSPDGNSSTPPPLGHVLLIPGGKARVQLPSSSPANSAARHSRSPPPPFRPLPSEDAGAGPVGGPVSLLPRSRLSFCEAPLLADRRFYPPPSPSASLFFRVPPRPSGTAIRYTFAPPPQSCSDAPSEGTSSFSFLGIIRQDVAPPFAGHAAPGFPFFLPLRSSPSRIAFVPSPARA